MHTSAPFIQNEVNINASPSLLFGPGDDDIARDCPTVCDSIAFDEEAVDRETVQIVPGEL